MDLLCTRLLSIFGFDMEKNIIAAVSDNNAIGSGNRMPWHISEDLKYFKRITSGGTVIMGRKTFLSIGKPLPGRTNIVITRGNAEGFSAGIEIARSLEEAFSKAESFGKPCFIIGGGEIYQQALPLADTLYITRVHTVIPDADTFFPEITGDRWEKVSSSEVMNDTESDLRFEFDVYRRK